MEGIFFSKSVLNGLGHSIVFMGGKKAQAWKRTLSHAHANNIRGRLPPQANDVFLPHSSHAPIKSNQGQLQT